MYISIDREGLKEDIVFSVLEAGSCRYTGTVPPHRGDGRADEAVVDGAKTQYVSDGGVASLSICACMSAALMLKARPSAAVLAAWQHILTAASGLFLRT